MNSLLNPPPHKAAFREPLARTRKGAHGKTCRTPGRASEGWDGGRPTPLRTERRVQATMRAGAGQAAGSPHVPVRRYPSDGNLSHPPKPEAPEDPLGDGKGGEG